MQSTTSVIDDVGGGLGGVVGRKISRAGVEKFEVNGNHCCGGRAVRGTLAQHGVGYVRSVVFRYWGRGREGKREIRSLVRGMWSGQRWFPGRGRGYGSTLSPDNQVVFSVVRGEGGSIPSFDTFLGQPIVFSLLGQPTSSTPSSA